MSKKNKFVFEKQNYRIFIISILLILTGFILMIGGGGITETDFNPDIFSSQRIIIAPIVIIIGYMGLGFSIFYND